MRSAFAGIVDYAGLFPPASCSMADAVRQYDAYRHSPERWMLGRFVVAAIRLEELGDALLAQGIATTPRDPWRLAVVMGVHVPDELALIAAFAVEWPLRGVLPDAVEYRVSTAGQIAVVGEDIPASFQRFFEVPHSGPYDALVAAIGEAGASAKLRTGGTSPGLFPSAAQVVDFIAASVKHGVPFKATAGLHHPWRGDYPISYAADAAPQRMHGFVNLLVATAELMRSGDQATALAIVEDANCRGFGRYPDRITWRDRSYSADALARAHQHGFVGFGSCSFREPVDELGMAPVT